MVIVQLTIIFRIRCVYTATLLFTVELMLIAENNVYVLHVTSCLQSVSSELVPSTQF